MQKFKLVESTAIEYEGHKLYRIEAIRDFGNVKKGDRGGYIEIEQNLSHEGDCWIYNDAKVYGQAKVFEYARIGEKLKYLNMLRFMEKLILYLKQRLEVWLKLVKIWTTT